MGGLPPPPPPPGGLGVPPPPGLRAPGVPGVLMAPAPAKPKKEVVNKPSQPLKAFFWDKLRDNELKDNVVWSEIGKDDIKLNEKLMQQIEETFSQKARSKPEEPAKAVQQKEQAKPKFVTCLDSKKSQQIAIMLQKYKLPIDDII